MARFCRARRLVLVPLVLATLWLTGVPGAAAAPEATPTTAVPGFYM